MMAYNLARERLQAMYQLKLSMTEQAENEEEKTLLRKDAEALEMALILLDKTFRKQ